MNRILWVFICILLIIVLFGVTASSCITYENMTSIEASNTANEYAQNLRDEIRNITNEINKNNELITTTQEKLDQTKTKINNLDKTAPGSDKLSNEYAMELERYKDLINRYKKDNIKYDKRIKLLEVDIANKTATADLIAQQNTNSNNNDDTGIAFVAGPDGKMTELKPTGDLGGSPTYYKPGTYKFGSATYVPSYEDSIYLSKTTGKSTVSTYLDEASIKGGACSYYKYQPEKLEEMCASIDKNNCGAMSCCVLLGGSKCVSGNKRGPFDKLNYGDITVRDKDYYYYQGKCYGNCK